jgi:hypothetical protein
MNASPDRSIMPCCSVSRHTLAHRADAQRRRADDHAEQRRFERACARELLGEID